MTAATALLAVSIYVKNPFAGAPPPPSIAHVKQIVSPVEAEQMDRAFDDLQLLHQLDAVTDGAKDPSRAM